MQTITLQMLALHRRRFQISNSSTTIIFQTAKATVLNPDENYSTETRLLFDSCSQRTYCTNDLKGN